MENYERERLFKTGCDHPVEIVSLVFPLAGGYPFTNRNACLAFDKLILPVAACSACADHRSIITRLRSR